ncbi:MAG: UDP-N-acetylglucosamine 1-carboxyvinyltransferase [Pseudomonadota bacterium]
MDRIAIIGGRPLYGAIPISGAKNSALKLMAAALLTDEALELTRVPALRDTVQLRELLTALGVRFETPKAQSMTLSAKTIESTVAPYELVRKMRASFNVLGPLLAREGRAKVSLPGGCAIGARPVDLHLKALSAMGAEIDLEDGYVVASAPRGLTGARVTFPFVSVGATEHALMAACLAKGETVLENAALEPEIGDLADCLVKMGAEIDGVGGSTLRIQGKGRLGGARHDVIADRIETGTYLMAVGAAGGELRLQGARADTLRAVVAALTGMGLEIEEVEDGLVARKSGDRLSRVDVVTQPYPGYPTDLQAQIMALAAMADGVSKIKETIFENRFMHAPELGRMGADISIDGKIATIRGRQRLKGAEVMATDLRASVSLVLAALGAEGQSIVHRVYHLDRGFEKLEDKLSACGALIERLKD